MQELELWQTHGPVHLRGHGKGLHEELCTRDPSPVGSCSCAVQGTLGQRWMEGCRHSDPVRENVL
jgi:hypothetical protein